MKNQKGGLGRIQFLEEGCWERGGWPFSGKEEGCSFFVKNKLKSEIFNDKKKFINKNVFLCHNYEFKVGNLITKNLVIFNR